MNFNPRTPCGVRRSAATALVPLLLNFNPRTPCGVRLRLSARSPTSVISIHAPLAGCDIRCPPHIRHSLNFNPRTPCGVRHHVPALMAAEAVFQSTHPLRGATEEPNKDGSTKRFQSTHPLRGATRHVRGLHAHRSDFNPRTPCGVRHGGTIFITVVKDISIHAPLAGCDLDRVDAALNAAISIHAPLAGCDSKNVQRKLHFF